MVDKKTNKPVVKKVKESKSERFLRLAKSRVESVLSRIRILGNCSNRGNYEYSQEQVGSMFSHIQVAIDEAYSKFTPSKTEQESFEF